MNNEPVAWAMFKEDIFMDAIHPDEHTRYEGGYNIPLYTHPVQKQMMVLDGNRVYPCLKELTDEEILKLTCEHGLDGELMVFNDFARAILLKAQEK